MDKREKFNLEKEKFNRNLLKNKKIKTESQTNDEKDNL